MKTNSILTNYFHREYNIDIDSDYEIEIVNAIELIVPERIDLIAKIKYIEYREKGYNLNFVKELYTAHIEAFSAGTFIEPGNESKNSIEKYYNSFNDLIDSIKENGIDENISVIPVGSNNAILDGAHRVAIAVYFNLKVPIMRFEDISVNYNTQYFREQLLDEVYIDYLVSQYCKIKENIYFSCIWPIAYSKVANSELNSIINNKCKIVFEKKIDLNYQGLRNLLIQIYSSHSWVGNAENRFAGTQEKVNSCYDENGQLTVYVLEGGEIGEILSLKKEIRNVFNIGNHSVHITDNQFETIQMANLLLNSNSVEFLNKGVPDYYIRFHKQLNLFKQKIEESNLILDDIIIDSSSSMALYGLRDAADLDFMSISDGFECLETKEISNHHNYINLYETTIDDLVLNPKNYFVYNDIKFVTLKVLRKFKKNRNEKKDQNDIELIDSMLTGNKNTKMLYLTFRNWIQKKNRNFKSIIKHSLTKLLKRVHLYDFAKKTLYFIRRVKRLHEL